MTSSPKTRLVWRWGRLRSIALALALTWLGVTLVWGFVDPVGIPVLLVSSGLFIVIQLAVWATIRMASRK